MSSSPATVAGSRSPSPATPDSSDGLDPVAIKQTLDMSSWYYGLRSGQSLPDSSWESDILRFGEAGKAREEPMLHLDELIEKNAYDDSPTMGLTSNHAYPSPPSDTASLESGSRRPSDGSPPSDMLLPTQIPLSMTQPIPPPASRPRKRDPSTAAQTVVFPPKDSCSNLPIITPNIPESGTKSRVETQVRVTIDLAQTTPSASEDPLRYDRIGSWKWLKLPSGTATKKRTRKEGKIDPAAEDILHLNTTVSCASPPYNRVLSCTSCQAREAKRVARKLAARVRPARSDSDSPEDGSGRNGKGKQEDTTSIVQFNCPEILDFSTGSTVLPLRITCYCRHHREKTGFIVHFTMTDDVGRVVGSGSTPPIMITDDHKSTSALAKHGTGLSGGMTPGMDLDWLQTSDKADSRAPSKRKGLTPKEQSKKRPKPYDMNRRSAKASRENSVTSFPSPSTSPSTLPVTRSPSPSSYSLVSAALSQINELLANSANGSPIVPSQEPNSICLSALPPPTSPSISLSDPLGSINHSADILMSAPPLQSTMRACPATTLADPVSLSSPVQDPATVFIPNNLPNNLPFMFFNQGPIPSMSSFSSPKIHRLIPNSGPITGGIEVTVLGANFHPSMQLNCVFGDTVASSTQRWSDNTLLCVLPPRATPGVVAVWFEGIEKEDDGSPPSLFTYTDESDRALMELALQVVGLKMTGKIEDAKNVAMRIVGSPAEEPSSGPSSNHGMQFTSASILQDVRRLTHGHEYEDFENRIIRLLSLLDAPVDDIISSIPLSTAMSHPTSGGQTLLHLAASLGFSSLVETLVELDIDYDARDRNGYTALHFAALSQSKNCARLLIQAGTDMEIVDACGKTAAELAPAGFFSHMMHNDARLWIEDWSESSLDSDEESRWGDAEGESEDDAIEVIKRHHRILRRHGTSTPNAEPLESAAADALDEFSSSEPEQDVTSVSEKKKLLRLDDQVNDKHAASLIDLLQRTLGQLHTPQNIIQLLPLLHLPGVAAVPWGVLQQLPVVFPLLTQTPGWPSLVGERQQEQDSPEDSGAADESKTSAAIRTAQEWRAMCEKWVLAWAAAAAAVRPSVEDTPPPVYTPRAPHAPSETLAKEQFAESSRSAVPVPSSADKHVSRRGYGYPPVSSSVPVTDQEVNAYVYRPQKREKHPKQDRMLILFWIPILIISLIWGFFMGIQSAFQILRTAFPIRAFVR